MRIPYRLTFSSVGILLFSQVAYAQEALTNVDLESGLLSGIQQALPESSNINQDFINPQYDPVLRLSEDAHVGITFIDEGAGYRNSLGYFTFSDTTFDNLDFGTIDSDSSGNISISELSTLNDVNTGMIFDNVSKAGSGGSLLAGDTAVLGGGTLTATGSDFTMDGGTTFSSGTNMGFFLLQNAYSGGNVNSDALTMFSVDFLNPENDAFATYDSANTDSRHVAMMFADQDQDEIILAFEDLDRTDPSANHWGISSDEDFNDAVFRIRTDPIEAISETNITIMAAPAPSLGGGLAGLIGITSLLAFGRKKEDVDDETS